MKTRILFPVMLVVLLCIPTLGLATAIPVGGPIPGNSWGWAWYTYVSTGYSDGWKLEILSPTTVYFGTPPSTDLTTVEVPYYIGGSFISDPPYYTVSLSPQTAVFSGGPTFTVDDWIQFTPWFTGNGNETFEMDFYQLYLGSTRWDESVRYLWDPAKQYWVYEGLIPQPVPEPAIIPLLIISLTCIAGLRRCWKD